MAASPFPRKPWEPFFEFLLILATPAPPPSTGSKICGLFTLQTSLQSSAVKNSSPQMGTGPRRGGQPSLINWAESPISSWGSNPCPLRGSHRTQGSRPGPTQTTSLLPSLFLHHHPPLPGLTSRQQETMNGGWGQKPIASQHRDRLPQFTKPAIWSRPVPVCL